MPWKPIAIFATFTTLLFALLTLRYCTKGPVPLWSGPPKSEVPRIGTEPIPTPSEAAAKAPTQVRMRNVWFHIDEDAYLDIHSLRGEMVSKTAGAPLNLDNKLSFVMKVGSAKIGMHSASLDVLMNRYIFGYHNAPLRDLHIETAGSQIRQTGIIHKLVDIKFTMLADVSASNGKIRIHPTKIETFGINGLSLMKTLGTSLQSMLKIPNDRGVSAEGNDLLLDPNRVLPPPKVELRLTGVHVEGDELIQVFDDGRHQPELPFPHPNEKNTMYFHGGTLRMGKLLMVDADMQVVDTDPGDAFDFFIDRYNDQLVAGFSRNQPNYGLLVFMRDYSDLGKAASRRVSSLR